jgi:phage baseplate assembly protein W
MLDAEALPRQDAENQYAAAHAALNQPAWPADHTPADPYGRTLMIVDGDIVLQPDDEGQQDLAVIVGKLELAQGIQVLIGTPFGSDIFNQIFGFDLVQTLMQPVATRQMRELVRLSTVKALGQEQRIRQIRAVAFVDEPAFLIIHPEITPEQQAAMALEQKTTRRWRLDALLDTRLGDQVAAGIQGIGP